jgi:hypothetical protein
MELPVTLPPIPEELFPADWSDLNIDDAPPFEIPAGDEAGTATEPADGDAEAKESADGDAAPALKVPADEAAPAGDKAAKDDATSESSTQE